ncbi:MAG: hypothetical protein LBE09_02700 [Christensenellaceae bacterium]|jgi:uncharacterized membrane protein YidH (DUF202 family)|nr:hypothetical protein [Christensenellaceae bacterium]
MELWFKKLMAQISFSLMRLLDGMNGLFRILTGLETIDTGNGESVDMLSYLMKSSTVKNVWLAIVAISIAVLGFLTLAAVIKTMSNHKKRQSKVIATFFSAVLSFFIVQAVIFAGIMVSGQILKSVDAVTSSNNTLTFSQRLMELSVDESGWREGCGPEDFWPSLSPDDVFGKYNTNLIGFEKTPGSYEEVTGENGERLQVPSGDTYSGGGIVDIYKTNIFILFAVSLLLVIIIGMMMLKLARRVFDVVLLYLIMPFTISSLPLDDGERFRAWRGKIVAKTLSIYGTVIAFNMFFLFTVAMQQMTAGGEKSFSNTIFSFLVIIGGVLTASGGSALFSSILGVSGAQKVSSDDPSVAGSGKSQSSQHSTKITMRSLVLRSMPGGKSASAARAVANGAVKGAPGAAVSQIRYGTTRQMSSQKNQTLKNTLAGKIAAPGASAPSAKYTARPQGNKSILIPTVAPASGSNPKTSTPST